MYIYIYVSDRYLWGTCHLGSNDFGLRLLLGSTWTFHPGDAGEIGSRDLDGRGLQLPPGSKVFLAPKAGEK